VSPAERAVLATSQARDLCLSLQRAFTGRPALERLREDPAAALTPIELRAALGLAWAEGNLALMRAALSHVPAARAADDPVLATFRDVSR
jgi:hypothetical protein